MRTKWACRSASQLVDEGCNLVAFFRMAGSRETSLIVHFYVSLRAAVH